MGIFGFLKELFGASQPQSEEQPKKGYQPDSYYTSKAYVGTPFERDVITFEKRKQISFPSKNGLYVAEILLLEYCSYGTYPQPSGGYPGFWWFEYGIRDIDQALSSLEERGFIRMGTAQESLSGLTAEELKNVLRAFSLPVSGKKADLIDRIRNNVSEEALSPLVSERKYTLTENGKSELRDNEYVPFMHKHPSKTIDDGTYGTIFNVWEVNRRIGNGSTKQWKTIVHSIEQERNLHDMQRKAKREAVLKEAEATNPKWAAEMHKTQSILKAQGDQLSQINRAEELYKDDVVALTNFWEELWSNGGLKFRGSKWSFRLADLYIKQKRYDDALRFVRRFERTEYKEKAHSYVERINGLKEKALKK